MSLSNVFFQRDLLARYNYDFWHQIKDDPTLLKLFQETLSNDLLVTLHQEIITSAVLCIQKENFAGEKQLLRLSMKVSKYDFNRPLSPTDQLIGAYVHAQPLFFLSRLSKINPKEVDLDRLNAAFSNFILHNRAIMSLFFVKKMLRVCRKEDREIKIKLFTSSHNPLRDACEYGPHFAKAILKASEGDMELRRALLKAPGDFLPPLYYAVLFAPEDLVITLLEASLPFKELDVYLRKYLRDLVWKPLSLTQRFLATLGRDPEKLKSAFSNSDEDRETVLHLALREKNREMVHLLLDYISNDQEILSSLFLKNRYRGLTLLHYCIQQKEVEIALRLYDLCGQSRSLKCELISAPNASTSVELSFQTGEFSVIRAIGQRVKEDKWLLDRLMHVRRDNFDILMTKEALGKFIDLVTELELPLAPYLSNAVFANTLLDYYPELFAQLVDSSAILETLPFKSPNEIQKIIDQLSPEELLKYANPAVGRHKTLSQPGVIVVTVGSPFVPASQYILELIREHHLKYLSEVDLEMAISPIQADLLRVKPVTFALFTQSNPDLGLVLARAATPSQLTCIIPMLSPFLLPPFLNTLSMLKRAEMIGLMTSAQKAFLLEKIDLLPPVFLTWKSGSWKREAFPPFILCSAILNPHRMQEVDALKAAFARNETFLGDLEAAFESVYLQIAQIQEEVKGLESSLEKEEVEDGPIDFITCEPLLPDALKIPKLTPESEDQWINRDTLRLLQRNEAGLIRHPHLSTRYDPPSEYQ